MRQSALTSRRLPVSLRTADGSNSTTNSFCMGHSLHCPVHLAVSQSCSFRTQNLQTQCTFYILPSLLLPFVFPHLPTWCVSPSVVGGIMGYCQAEPISCPLWQWQHRTDTAKDNIAANVTKLFVSCADSSALLPRGTAGGNRSLSSFLDAAVGAMNVAEMLLNLLQSCWSSVAQPWHWVMPFHLRDIAGIAIMWMRLRVVFSSVITLLHSNSPLTPQMVHKWCLHTCWNSWTLFPKICSAGRYLPQLSGAVSISLEIF